MNDSFRMRLYALTCIACIAWLAQSVTSALKDGTLTTVPSIILIICIAVPASARRNCGLRKAISMMRASPRNPTNPPTMPSDVR